MLVQLLGPGLEGHFSGFEVPGDISHHSGRWTPEPGKHGLAVRISRYGRGEIWLAVVCTRNARGRVIEPLRSGRRGHHEDRRDDDPVLEHGSPPSALSGNERSLVPTPGNVNEWLAAQARPVTGF